MAARNADRGGQRQQLRAESKYWRDALDAYVDLADQAKKLRGIGGAS